MSPFHPHNPHVSDLPAAAHPPQRAHTHRHQDALQVFFAVARNVLTLLTRRLDADERKAIRSGNVYIWEDRSASTVDNGGLTMERWCALLPFSPSSWLPHTFSPCQDRRNVMGTITHTGGSFAPPETHATLTYLCFTPLVVIQEFLFYYQRDPAQERLPSGGG